MMKAIVCGANGGLEVMQEKQVAMPEVREHDLLVQLKAVAMNPIDCKLRSDPALSGGITSDKIFGFDGCGVVTKLGGSATGFAVGDEVMFAGDITRDGTNAEYIAIDSRICAKKPTSFDATSSAALPLVCLTAWEMLFENLRMPTDGSGKDLVFLIINGAGGVGSASIQLAKHVMGSSTVIATASRDSTIKWCKDLGADHVINHRNNLKEELEKIGVDAVDVCFCAVDLELHYDSIVDLMRPGGHIGAITIADPTKIDVSKMFFPKRLTLSFEVMFTRSMFNLKPEKQGVILSQVAKLVDEGKFKDIVTTKLDGLSSDTIKEMQKLQESGKGTGKIVATI